jgi:hypothetical protein
MGAAETHKNIEGDKEVTDVFVAVVCCISIYACGFISGVMHERGKWLDRMKGWWEVK